MRCAGGRKGGRERLLEDERAEGQVLHGTTCDGGNGLGGKWRARTWGRVREGCGRVVGRVELAMMAWLGGAGKVEGRGQGRDEFEFTK